MHFQSAGSGHCLHAVMQSNTGKYARPAASEEVQLAAGPTDLHYAAEPQRDLSHCEAPG